MEVGRPMGGWVVASFPAWNKEVVVRIQPGGKFWSERAGSERACVGWRWVGRRAFILTGASGWVIEHVALDDVRAI